MQVGDTVLHVNGTDPKVRRVHLDALSDNSFAASARSGGLLMQWLGWGQIFDNEIEADRAIVRNIDRGIASHQRQIDDLLEDRAAVLARLAADPETTG